MIRLHAFTITADKIRAMVEAGNDAGALARELVAWHHMGVVLPIFDPSTGDFRVTRASLADISAYIALRAQPTVTTRTQ